MEPLYKLVLDPFVTIQGEGANVGKASVFVRFSYCNHRCTYCDTKFDHVLREVKQSDLVEQICAFTTPFVVFTGGEPALQLDKGLIDALHARGRVCAIETNGTHDVSDLGLDWICVSPKGVNGQVVKDEEWKQRTGNELKVLFPDAFSLDMFFNVDGFDHYWVSPIAGEVTQSLNLEKAIEFVKEYPRWKLNTQVHKLLWIP